MSLVRRACSLFSRETLVKRLGQVFCNLYRIVRTGATGRVPEFPVFAHSMVNWKTYTLVRCQALSLYPRSGEGEVGRSIRVTEATAQRVMPIAARNATLRRSGAKLPAKLDCSGRANRLTTVKKLQSVARHRQVRLARIWSTSLLHLHQKVLFRQRSK